MLDTLLQDSARAVCVCVCRGSFVRVLCLYWMAECAMCMNMTCRNSDNSSNAFLCVWVVFMFLPVYVHILVRPQSGLHSCV